MNRTKSLFFRLLLLCLCLLAAGCMMTGPNPWTVDPHADCRSLGLTPGSMRFNECLLASKDLQAGRTDAISTSTQKSNADIDALAAQKLQTRACNPTTGLCGSGLLQQ